MNTSHGCGLMVPCDRIPQRKAPLTEQLPLGATDAPEKPFRGRARPYGATFAVTAAAIDIDLSTARLDPARNIAIVTRDGEDVPLSDPRLGLTLHSSGAFPHEDEIFDKDEKY